MNFKPNHGKYYRDNKWRLKRSKDSILFWKTADKKEQSEKIKKGWTKEKRLAQGKLLKQRWKNKDFRNNMIEKKLGSNNPRWHGRHK